MVVNRLGKHPEKAVDLMLMRLCIINIDLKTNGYLSLFLYLLKFYECIHIFETFHIDSFEGPCSTYASHTGHYKI